ncbi:hypothetical protein C2G38_2188747 [Gigaspora rosea]|uniref:Uncharacterized protein n=1 Tax=Gigaspora rosea TaxID=44941 RepID=A0A397V6G5_9GLOM|nr:hypothetical protein C2G38_2188747 [Gigaspora rosea]
MQEHYIDILNLEDKSGKLADALRKSIETEGGKANSDALCKNAMLTPLDLDNHRREENTLADALRENTSRKYQKFDQINNRFGDIDSGSGEEKALADALYKNITLTYLNPEGNRLGAKWKRHLADVLCLNTALTSLKFSKSSSGSEGENA